MHVLVRWYVPFSNILFTKLYYSFDINRYQIGKTKFKYNASVNIRVTARVLYGRVSIYNSLDLEVLTYY